MSSKKPVAIYPEYFDHRLKRSEGRKVPLSEAVKSPNVEELSSILSNLGEHYFLQSIEKNGDGYLLILGKQTILRRQQLAYLPANGP